MVDAFDGKKVQICYVVNRNEDVFVIFCIKFVPSGGANIQFFLDIQIIYILDYKNP